MALKLNYMTGNPRALKILMAAKLANVEVASHLVEWKDLEVNNLNNKRHQNIWPRIHWAKFQSSKHQKDY